MLTVLTLQNLALEFLPSCCTVVKLSMLLLLFQMQAAGHAAHSHDFVEVEIDGDTDEPRRQMKQKPKAGNLERYCLIGHLNHLSFVVTLTV